MSRDTPSSMHRIETETVGHSILSAMATCGKKKANTSNTSSASSNVTHCHVQDSELLLESSDTPLLIIPALSILELPSEICSKILFYLSYDELSRKRQICKFFDTICTQLLNDGFAKAEKFHALVQKEVRNRLPRRESERRNHPYSRHADILSAIETRMSLLQITYAKYIESGYCCFIPGKVLDELFSVLRYVRTEINPPRSHEVLTELRDISSMAMEHFEEKILPGLRERLIRDGVAVLPGGLTVGLDQSEPTLKRRDLLIKRPGAIVYPYSTPRKRPRLSSVDGSASRGVFVGSTPRRESSPSSDASSGGSDSRLLLDRLTEAESTIEQQSTQLEEQTKCIEELNRKLTEFSHRFNDLADVLRIHFETSKLTGAERITAIFNENSKSLGERSVSEVKIDSRFTRLVPRKRKYGLSHKSSLTRAKELREQMDRFKDEFKL